MFPTCQRFSTHELSRIDFDLRLERYDDFSPTHRPGQLILQYLFQMYIGFSNRAKIDRQSICSGRLRQRQNGFSYQCLFTGVFVPDRHPGTRHGVDRPPF